MIILADDQAIEQALFQELQRHRQQSRQVRRHQDTCAGVAELMRQRDLAIERRQMHDAGTGLERAEEIDRMVRRIAEEERDRGTLAKARTQERGRSLVDEPGERVEADRTVAEFECAAIAEVAHRFRQQLRQGAARDRRVPADAFGIELLAGMGHEDSVFLAGRQPRSLRSLPSCGGGSGKGVAPGETAAVDPHPRPLSARGRGARLRTEQQ